MTMGMMLSDDKERQLKYRKTAQSQLDRVELQDEGPILYEVSGFFIEARPQVRSDAGVVNPCVCPCRARKETEPFELVGEGFGRSDKDLTGEIAESLPSWHCQTTGLVKGPANQDKSSRRLPKKPNSLVARLHSRNALAGPIGCHHAS
jgi:hypothetical protein